MKAFPTEILNEEMPLLVHTGLCDGGCECMFLIWGEPEIKYLSQEGRGAQEGKLISSIGVRASYLESSLPWRTPSVYAT